jgi:hypothetical protein
MVSGLQTASNWQQRLYCSMSAVYTRDAHYPGLGEPNQAHCHAWTDNIFRWLIYKIVDIIRYRAVQHTAVLVSGIVTNILIIISVLSAFPWVRKLVVAAPIHFDHG